MEISTRSFFFLQATFIKPLNQATDNFSSSFAMQCEDTSICVRNQDYFRAGMEGIRGRSYRQLPAATYITGESASVSLIVATIEREIYIRALLSTWQQYRSIAYVFCGICILPCLGSYSHHSVPNQIKDAGHAELRDNLATNTAKRSWQQLFVEN